MIWKSVLAVFFGMALADVLWAIYFLSIASKKKYLAGISSGMIILMQSTITVEYVHNPVLRYAAAGGAAFGTFGILFFNDWWEKRKNARK